MWTLVSNTTSSTERTALGSAMAARVDALAKSAPAREPVDTAVEGETASRLSALGYVGRGAVDVPRGGRGTFAIDPKDCIGRYNEIVRRRSELAPHSAPATHPNAASPECGALAFLRPCQGCGLGIIERAQIDLMAVSARQKPTLC